MTAAAPGHCAFHLATPPPDGHAAIAAIDLQGDIDWALQQVGTEPVRIGEAPLRDLCGVDRGLIARWSERHASIMPHAGPVIVAQVCAALEARGLARTGLLDPHAAYPEAGSLIEARMLFALAQSPSPLAVDLLLDQPRRWASAGADAEHDPEVRTRSQRLNRLIHPPTVVTIGPPNIGKSTLLNALAGRQVSIVYDAPGTTRDHVGCTLNLGGLVVHWLDTPGLTPPPSGRGPGGGRVTATARSTIEQDAQAIAQRAAIGADLIVLCADAHTDFPPAPVNAKQVVRLALRADLGDPPSPADLRVSASRGEGLADLVASIRERLVPQSAVGHSGLWIFWGASVSRQTDS